LAVLALGAITVVSGTAVIGVGTAGATPTNVATNQVTAAGLTLVAPPGTPANVYPGVADQPATNWKFQLNNTFANLDTLVLDLPTCVSATDFVGFAATPSVSVVPTGGITGETAQTFVVTLGSQPGPPTGTEGPLCAAAGVKDELHITILGNSSAGTNPWDVTISGVSYTVGSAHTTPGDVHLQTPFGPDTGLYLSSTSPVVPGTNPYPFNVDPNATLKDYKITANTPPVGVPPNSTNQAISNVVVTEFVAGTLSAGTYTTCSGAEDGVSCVGNNGTFSNGSSPVFSVTGGGAAVVPTVTVANGELTLTIAAASTTGPAVYTLSGLVVNAGSDFGNVTSGIQGVGSTPGDDPVIYSVTGAERIQGQVATDTSANLFQSYGCNNFAVLATSDNYPDALSAAYLASPNNYDTSVIITPTAAVATATLNALRIEGVQTVLVVGGPLAISPADIATLQSTPSYHCQGLVRTHSGITQMLTVNQIYGQDQYGTAQAVAQFPAVGNVGDLNNAMPGAYGGTYNDTTGANGTAALSSPANPVPSAILATGVNFPDAMAASATAWNESVPILLTEKGSLAPEASAAILNDGIQQVIVMGGPDAISDNVLTQLEAMGVAVFRIGGIDMTDTAQLLARFELNRTTGPNYGQGVRNGLDWHNYTGALTVTRGDNWQDALSASNFAGYNRQPLLVTFDPNTVGTYLASFLNAAGSAAGVGTGHSHQFFGLTILGGPYAISAATQAALLNDLAT
jgi:putative cell wall-binding protein